MSTRDPSKDEYLELETRLGRAEQTLAADLADADEELAGASHELARAGSGVASSGTELSAESRAPIACIHAATKRRSWFPGTRITSRT